MTAFWEGGCDALDKGYRAEIARLKKAIKNPESLEDEESLQQALDALRAEYQEVCRAHLLF